MITSTELFVCFGPPNKGSPASKQRMNKWVVEAISLAYESAGQPSPIAVQSHSTRSMAASKALISRVALQEVCDAAGWSSPHTFIRFYSLDLDSTPGCQVHASLCCSLDFTQDRHLSLWWGCINVPHSVSDETEFPWKGTFGYDCNLGSTKRERTLRPQLYLIRACKRLAQTFKLVTASFGQTL